MSGRFLEQDKFNSSPSQNDTLGGLSTENSLANSKSQKVKDVTSIYNILSSLCTASENIYKNSDHSDQQKAELSQSIGKTLNELLNHADIELDNSEMIEFFNFDKKKRESKLFDEFSKNDILLFREVLRHRSTDRFLDYIAAYDDEDFLSGSNGKKTDDNGNNITTRDPFDSHIKFLKSQSNLAYFCYVLIGIFYPFLTIASYFKWNARRVVSTYPMSYFINWGTYFWTMIILIYHAYYESWWTFSMMFLLVSSKCKEEYQQFKVEVLVLYLHIVLSTVFYSVFWIS